jgi:hypothetical protein
LDTAQHHAIAMGLTKRDTRRSALRRVLGGAAMATAGTRVSTIGSDAKKPRKCKLKRCKGHALGEACQNVRDCCGTETNMGCLTAKYSPETMVCCGMNGFACSSAGDCCDGFTCSNITYTCELGP